MKQRNLMILGGVIVVTMLVTMMGPKPAGRKCKVGSFSKGIDGSKYADESEYDEKTGKFVCPKVPGLPSTVVHNPPAETIVDKEKQTKYTGSGHGSMRIHEQIKSGRNPSGYCFAERLQRCANEIKPEQLPVKPPVTAGVEIEGHLLFGRMLYCMGAQPEINRFFDVFGHVGQGSSYLIAHGLHDSGPSNFLINIEHDQGYWENQQKNLAGLPVMSLYGATVQRKPHGPLLEFICNSMDVDAVLVDGPRKNTEEQKKAAWKEWRLVINTCRPKYLILHNSNVHEEHKVWAKEMINNPDYDIALVGEHSWEVTPDFPHRLWQMYIRRD